MSNARSRLLAAAALLAACSGPGVNEPALTRAPAITGASPVEGAHRAVVGLGVVSGPQVAVRCSAVLIAPGAALTAAHCLSPPTTLSLLLGDDASAPSRTVTIREQLPHPLYVGDGNAPLGVAQANDLALLLLEEPLTGITPLALPRLDAAALVAGDEVELVGVGAAGPAGPVGPKRAATARITTVGEFELQISKPGEPQACDGDSGGPAIAAGVVVGLVSRATANDLLGCEEGAIYTRVDAYVDDSLITDNITLPCGSGGAKPCGDAGADGDAAATEAGATPGADAGGPVTGVGGIRGTPSPRGEDGCAIGAISTDCPLGPLLTLLLLGLTVSCRAVGRRRAGGRHRAIWRRR